MKEIFTRNMNISFGKTVAITGATGGLGREICFHLARQKANIVLLDRNINKSLKLEADIKSLFPNTSISRIILDLSDFESVKRAAEELKKIEIDFLVLNAAVYSVPRAILDTGFDNVFQINFVSQYFLVKELLPELKKKNGKVIALGSIAHTYSKTDCTDIDFKKRKESEKVYGNSKRFLMFSLLELFKNEKDVSCSIVHPGITFTNITAHYPKLLFAIIKYPMKIIFMKPKKASLCVIKGMLCDTQYDEWIGPRFFNVWGLPKTKKLDTCEQKERKFIFNTSEEIYKKIRG